MGEQKPEKTKKHICAGLLAHVYAGTARIYPTRTPVQRAHSGNFLPFQ